MQNELTDLRPKLLETSDETERLMIKIEQDTIQACFLWFFISYNYVLPRPGSYLFKCALKRLNFEREIEMKKTTGGPQNWHV